MKYNVGDKVKLKSYYKTLTANVKGIPKMEKIKANIREPITILYKEKFFYQAKFYSDDTIYLITDETIERKAKTPKMEDKLLTMEQNKVPTLRATAELLRAFFGLNQFFSHPYHSFNGRGE